MSNLRVEKLQAGYDRRLVFQDLNFAVEEGKITTIIGPNGCGKSTLLKTMGRILRQKSGTVYLYDQDIRQLATQEIAQKLAVLPQNPVAPAELKVEELVAYGRFPYFNHGQRDAAADRQAVEWAIQMANIMHLRHRELSQLSGGERQRVWLAMALAQETAILLLDEPTTYLDMVHQLEVLTLIKHLNQMRKTTVVMVLHDINHAARFSHKIVAMKAGRIVAAGTPQTIVTAEVLRTVFHIDARIMMDPREGVPVCFCYDTIQSENLAAGVQA